MMRDGRRFICHKLGIEYFEMPKVACTSIKTALLLSDGVKPAPGRFDAHWDQHWYRRTVEPGFRFTFIRHPLDRLVSCYHQKIATGESWDIDCNLSAKTSFEDVVRFVVGNPRPNEHYAPQTAVLRRAGCLWVGHFEGLRKAWGALQRRFPGLADLPHKNRSRRPRDWRDLFDAETLELAARYYRRDFERWPEYAADLEVACA